MPLNKQKGNMYGFVTHTWNPIKGRCLHNCYYCYMHRFWGMVPDDTLRLDEKEFKTNLGEGNFIFVGSSTDMWANNIKTRWQERVVGYIENCSKNTYLFQTKNPKIWKQWWCFKKNVILGITLETNKSMKKYSNAPSPESRAEQFAYVNHTRKMITIEPIIQFDLKIFVEMIKIINPEWVNIGADSSGNKLGAAYAADAVFAPEPSKEKVLELIIELEKFTKVHQKLNLKRLME